VSKEGNHRVYRFRRSFHILQGFASITALVLVQTCGPRPLRPEPESVERAAPELIGDFTSTLTVISDLSTGLASGLGIRAAPPMNQPNQHHARLRIAGRDRVKTLLNEVMFLGTLHAPGKRACIEQPTLQHMAGRGARDRARLYQNRNGR